MFLHIVDVLHDVLGQASYLYAFLGLYDWMRG